jgi:hypothetical protein
MQSLFRRVERSRCFWRVNPQQSGDAQGGGSRLADAEHGWKEERDDEQGLASTLEDGLAQTHSLLHLPAKQTA